MQVDAILIDQAKFGEALRQARASNFDLPAALGLQRADRDLKIILNKPGVGADRLVSGEGGFEPLRNATTTSTNQSFTSTHGSTTSA